MIYDLKPDKHFGVLLNGPKPSNFFQVQNKLLTMVNEKASGKVSLVNY